MTTRILALSGSLRAASTNTAVLRAAAELAPEGVEVLLHDYRDVPLYDDDLDKPDSVVRLEEAIRAADGVLISTPEYNHSIPGVLKNALDHASRPAWRSVLRGKPVAVVSAAGSFVGGARAQAHLKDVLLGVGAVPFSHPEVLIGRSGTKVVDGRLVDEPTREVLARFVAAFAESIG